MTNEYDQDIYYEYAVTISSTRRMDLYLVP